MIDVCHADIHPCTGCVHCGYEGPCVQKDDMEIIRGRLLQTDMVVFATLLYYYGMSAQMKTVVDCFCEREDPRTLCRNAGQKMGGVRDYSGVHPRDRVAPLHVRDDPDRGFFPETGDAGGLAGSIYDGLRPSQPAAHDLQCRAGKERTHNPYPQLLFLRCFCRTAGLLFLPGQGVL